MESKKIVILSDAIDQVIVDPIVAELQKYNSAICVLHDHEFVLKRVKSIDDINHTVIALRSSFFKKSNIKVISTEEYQKKICEFALVYTVYSIDNEVLGFIAFYANDHVNKFGYISIIIINSAWHRCGLGKLLISIAYSISQLNGMTTLGVVVHKENENAMKFYKTMGFNRYDNKKMNGDYIPLIMSLI
jgi:ribosomal protein S18 acetylase RimI-like enzyme